MTKIVKWWKKMIFWTKLKSSVAGLGIGTEITLFVADSAEVWKWIAGGATFLGYLITVWIEDADKDGIADIFQDKKK